MHLICDWLSANEVRATLNSRSDFCSSVFPKDGLSLIAAGRDRFA